MSLLIPLSSITGENDTCIGGKAFSLARLNKQDWPIPRSYCLPTSAYRNYLNRSGLAAMIDMELGRKNFAEMRWEEIWDAALRIRNLFLRTPLPEKMEQQLRNELVKQLGNLPVVVRSSAPGEDSAEASFAGLHESIVNLQGPEQIIDGIRKVWASLWSDRALLYRQELALDPQKSSMAVLVQELIDGEKSGVAFSVNPNNGGQAVIEAVWGLNQGLVDGSIQPDQWLFQRPDGPILLHQPAQREEQLKPSATGVILRPLNSGQFAHPPLTEPEAKQVFSLVMQLEQQFGCPQDCEWTFAGQELIVLQSRPTTQKPSEQNEDARQGFLNLHRSFGDLQKLRQKIEGQLLPAMENDAARLALLDITRLDNRQLAREIEQRRQLMKDWEASYVEYCIPMAHGVRLFGQLYNDRLKPADPFEFIALLQKPGFRAIQRNSSLQQLAQELLSEPAGDSAAAHDQLANLRRDYALPDMPDELLLDLFRQLAKQQTSAATVSGEREDLENAYSAAFTAEEKIFAAEVLDLARASYRLRDDDNISMGKVRQQLEAAEAEAKRRLLVREELQLQALFADQKQEQFHPASRGRSEPDANRFLSSLGRISFRQLQGQPAGPGIASGIARVVRGEKDLWQVKRGEVLVCDAIDPTMTFVVPLAAAIVERRGGMLIHGAIIAREYGIPCVTGVADAAERITTGDRLTVDGYLGLIILTQQSDSTR